MVGGKQMLDGWLSPQFIESLLEVVVLGGAPLCIQRVSHLAS